MRTGTRHRAWDADCRLNQLRSVLKSTVSGIMRRIFICVSVLIWLAAVSCQALAASQPNVLFVLTDDQRWDTVATSGNEQIRTPNLDRISRHGTHFKHAFVTLAICSPSRAACLTGRYGSSNGVTSVGKVGLNDGEPTFAKAIGEAGYTTGVTGKWHLRTTPEDCGFDFVSTCAGNGTWYDRKFTIDGETKTMPGFVDDVVAGDSGGAAGGTQQRREHADRRALTGAVRAEESEHLTGVDPQVDAVDRLHGVVAGSEVPLEAFGDDGWRVGHRPRVCPGGARLPPPVSIFRLCRERPAPGTAARVR